MCTQPNQVGGYAWCPVWLCVPRCRSQALCDGSLVVSAGGVTHPAGADPDCPLGPRLHCPVTSSCLAGSLVNLALAPACPAHAFPCPTYPAHAFPAPACPAHAFPAPLPGRRCTHVLGPQPARRLWRVGQPGQPAAGNIPGIFRAGGCRGLGGCCEAAAPHPVVGAAGCAEAGAGRGIGGSCGGGAAGQHRTERAAGERGPAITGLAGRQLARCLAWGPC